ncbi:aminomethyl-transferring glycine dehydrogenase [Asticcacaulis sp. BYS171W]|uniref:Glycine dehydrogenase (decarboxylating) n=1 Tax=Asticcacaulis aquaticus TaxID=2984212 RepID=A0ABT5HUN7_9CAUL|nr:aminomethyl-transferring glycine dehydrogenase [Asticcacaulis aquaticus]MDC7683791.1 aminomethyl-transferring glycine dehydrogenase [Asticcacaulis aquaticus]
MSRSNQSTPGPFVRRHIGPSEGEIAAMLDTLKVSDIDELIDQTIPVAIRERTPIGIGAGLTEVEVLAKLREIADQNTPLVSLIGQGYYGTLLPGVIQRNILENPAWYTAYTPYQPEISQGRLEALLNYQTLLCDLTGLDVANASLLDEATAAAEAMALARRSSRVKADRFFVDADTHPQTIAVIRTRAEPLNWEVVVGDPATAEGEFFGLLLQYPGTSGEVRDFRAVIADFKTKGAIVSMAADPLALTLLTSPGDLGAEIAIGSMQRYGVPMGYGGPHAAYMVVRDALKRSMPGRLVGVSVDSRGEPAYRLALQTREQHIRREKATSNICTAQVLLAVIASMYAVYHGPDGLKAIARTIHGHADTLAQRLRGLGYDVVTKAAFDTITVKAADVAALHARAVEAGFNLRRIDDQHVGVSLDESITAAVLERIVAVFADGKTEGATGEGVALPDSLLRHDDILTHPVFHLHRSETEMLRYMRRLSDKDLALDRTMIPLGSCTMKLNATTEMIPITWPEFSNLHPYAPVDQAQGYKAMFDQLEAYLCAISGYDSVSLQPNSGAQGEYAGLLAIRGYHLSRGDTQRDICLIPASAHGTNPASAQMVGMKTVVVACDSDGNVDFEDFKVKVAQHAANLACIMITYPSTHGVFEEHITDICDLVHEAGGQVYLDGANLNAQVGLSRPGHYGSDVSHFNLHKTFCIPHGGGGPGMGPIGVKSHLTPFLPSDPQTGEAGAVSAAHYGSASILPISFAYMLLMGDEGLRQATEVAILNANYIAERLEGHYPVLYRGENGRVAHECIIDVRPIKDATGVTVDDIAKRLIDHGFHAPTMSFPVAGTLMIEPTESEAKTELDRFCDAMIDIKREIDDVASGRFTHETSPLRHAPHTVFDLAGDWDRAYSRQEGCFPTKASMANKYWSPVGRIDNVYGDRNLVCSCPPMESYMDEAAE